MLLILWVILSFAGPFNICYCCTETSNELFLFVGLLIVGVFSCSKEQHSNGNQDRSQIQIKIPTVDVEFLSNLQSYA